MNTMAQLEISPQVAQRLQDLSKQTRTSIDDILLRLLEHSESLLVSADTKGTNGDLVWTDEELAEILTPKQPLTGQEMVEQGYIGGWEDLGIEDSVEWLEQQKAKRRTKHQW
jgi:cytochrome c2